MFRTPRSIAALTGPAPRTIADDCWAKLLWAGINLTAADFSPGACLKVPTEKALLKALSTLATSLQMVQSIAMVWLFAGLRSDEIRRLRVGCVRPAALARAPDGSVWLLDARCSGEQNRHGTD